MRLKALLIDDEMNILRNLEKVLPWEELNIEVVGLAKNGVAAMELVKAHRPELILCDIRMPVLDGIGFLEQLRAAGAEAEVVMLTGYQEFEYARSVIKFGVREYILKPINYEELEAVVERLAGEVRARRQEKQDEASKLGKAMHMAYEKLLQDALMDAAADGERLVLAAGDVRLDAMRYVMLLADFDDYSHKCRSSNEQERKLWNFAVRNVLQEALVAEGRRYAVLQTREGEWCVLVELEGALPDADEIRRWAGVLQRAVWGTIKINLSIGIIPDAVPFGELSERFRLLQRTVHLAADKDRSVIVAAGGGGASGEQEELWEPIERLVSALKRNDRGGVDEAVERLAGRFLSAAEHSLARVQKVAHFCVLHLLREMRELDALSTEEEREIWRVLDGTDRVKDMLALVRRIADACKETLLRKKTGDVLMHAAKDYIERNLSRDLGIDELADHLGISASYFSLLFKQHFGATFVEYVTAERIAMAQSMLLLTDKSITEIGRAVGYAERRYFSKVFQKMTGEIPSEFREKRKSS